MDARSAVAVVRLAIDLDEKDDDQGDMEMLNTLIGGIDLEAARATIYEMAFLTACLLRSVQEDHPGIEVDEFLGNWGLRLATGDPV